MSLVSWPAQLPLPEQSGYAIQHVSPIQRTTMVSGRARQRRVYTSVPSNVAVQWFLTEQQARLFEVFFRYAITDGADWFLLPLKTPMFAGDYECRFTGIYEGPTLTAFNKWTVSATIEIKERQTLSSDEIYDPQGIIDSENIDRVINKPSPQLSTYWGYNAQYVYDSAIIDRAVNSQSNP